MVKKVILLKCLVPGRSHVENSIPCQDACSYKKISEDAGIFAIADGAGSAKNSEIGSKLIVETSIKITSNYLKKISINKRNCKNIIFNIFKETRTELIKKSNELNTDVKNLAATLILVLMYPNKIISGHIGDGGVVAHLSNKDDFIIISEPERQEYINETTFITSNNWDSALRIIHKNIKIDNIFVFSDGIQRGVLNYKDNRYVPYNNFFNPIYKFLLKKNNNNFIIQELKSLLSSEKMNKISYDDKSLAIGFYK